MGRPLKVSSNNNKYIIEKYLKGVSLHELGRHFSVSAETIRSILVKNKIKIRNSEEVNKRYSCNIDMLKDLYINKKISILKIAKMLNSGYKAIRNTLLRHKILLRKKYEYDHTIVSELTKSKISLSKLGRPGKPMSEEKKEHLRKLFTGRKFSKEIRDKISKIRIEKGLSKGNKNPMSKPENIKKWVISNKISPNKKERTLDIILNELLPGQYTINVQAQHLILDGKIPDFVSLKDKKLIELYGDYWHRNDKESDRINLFKKFNYDTLIIWEKELKNESELKNKILQFNGGTYDLC